MPDQSRCPGRGQHTAEHSTFGETIPSRAGFTSHPLAEQQCRDSPGPGPVSTQDLRCLGAAAVGGLDKCRLLVPGTPC